MMRGEVMGVRVSTVLLLGAIVVVIMVQPSAAAVYKVGDDKGWTFGIAGWERGKIFQDGDILVFSYDTKLHNVVRVDKAGYDGCTVPPNAPILRSGNDQLKLQLGPNYFLCATNGHCLAGMKIAPFAA